MGLPMPFLAELFVPVSVSVNALKEFGLSILESVASYRYLPLGHVAFGHLGVDLDLELDLDFRSSLQSPSDYYTSCGDTILASLPCRQLVDPCQEEHCAVCLCEFQARQQVRQLPQCHHVFHRDCIDSWVGRYQRTCPLCRSSLEIEPMAAQKRDLSES